MLDASAAQALILTAPAGYGKTSLVCEWLEGQANVAWYRATSGSADLAAFSAGIAEVIEPFLPGAGGRLRQRIRVGDPPEKALRPLAELLAEDIAAWPEGAWLVVDDYHLVTDSAPVEEFMDWLLMLAPLRVIVTTRRRPAWATARRVLYGEIAEIGREQLAMTDQEAAQVLAGRPADAMQAIVAQAQGWPALLGLAALSSAEVPGERVSEELFLYFAEEVFRNEPPEVQEFMLVAAVPQTFDATIARDVLEVPEPDETIARLLAHGLLQQSTHGELAFHPLLRDFLRRRLELADAERANYLADQVMSFAKSVGRWDEAFDLSMHLGRTADAVGIAGAGARDLLDAGRTETLEKWLTALGSAAFRDASCLIARVEVLLRQVRLVEAADVATRLAESLPVESSLVSRAWCLAGQASHLNSDNATAFTDFTKASELARTLRDKGNAIWGACISGIELEQDISVFVEDLETLGDDDPNVRLQAACARMFLEMHRGGLHAAATASEAAHVFLEQSTDPISTSNFCAFSGYVSLMRGRYDQALERVAHAERPKSAVAVSPPPG
jgi:LuxR family maltose regulon positive regulatory protein